MCSHRLASVLGLVQVALWATSAGGLSVRDIVEQVSQQQYQNNLDNRLYTRPGDDRGMSGAQHDLARNNILNHFLSLGLNAVLDRHPPQQGWPASVNVVATKPGKTRPQDIYIVSAHYDSYDNPGADDDASGVAAVMEIARVMAPYAFEATVVFIVFDAEESCRSGSRSYAYDHQADRILGVLNIDMIARNNNGSNTACITNTVSKPIAGDLAAAVRLYGRGLTPLIRAGLLNTDNDSFASYDLNACNLIEVLPNPRMHDDTDSIGTAGYIDYLYATNMTRSAAGCLAAEAVPLTASQSPRDWVPDQQPASASPAPGKPPAPEPQPPAAGDIDGDGHVDVSDLLTLAASFGAIRDVHANYSVRADLDGNGTVDLLDLLVIVQDWTG